MGRDGRQEARPNEKRGAGYFVRVLLSHVYEGLSLDRRGNFSLDAFEMLWGRVSAWVRTYGAALAGYVRFGVGSNSGVIAAGPRERRCFSRGQINRGQAVWPTQNILNSSWRICLECPEQGGTPAGPISRGLTNLGGADLSGANLSDGNLLSVSQNWARAKLSGANLSGARAPTVFFNEANVSGANLSGASLICANLNWADLSGANLSSASLVGANLANANLTGCSFYGISAWSAKLSEGTKQQDLVLTAPSDQRSSSTT
jgi:hypothetical protein